MQYDEIINCPKSGGDLCYKVEISKDITNFLSLSCGFWTNTLMKEGSEFYNEQLITLPELYKDLAWEDPETNLIWIPNTINLPESGMVFANGASKNEWSWAGVKAIKLEEGDEAKVEGQTHKMDMSTLKSFTERDYMDALSYIGVLPE
mgnify:FL=1|jgi:hypothetical protein|tara:strand:- start:568 stop:1011 length:444 start_codon:yes stop_codon:yes gene_type:complete